MVKQTKICFLVTNIFDLGGVQRVVSVLANEFSKHYSIDIVCVAENIKIDRKIYDLDENIKIHIKEDILKKSFFQKLYYKTIKTINTHTSIFTNKRFLTYITNIYYPKISQKKLINFLNLENFDIVIGVEGYLSILLAIIAPQLNIKTIGWQHNSFDAYFRNKKRYYWKQDSIFKTNIPNLDKYIVLTNADKRKFNEIFNIKCDVIPNPRSFESQKKSDVSKKQFLAAGRFTYQKGFDLLIESFNVFSRYNKDWNLIIVGEGEEREHILQLIKKYSLESRISIQPFTDNIKDYFFTSSVLLLPSRWEGMPMIVLESLEMGVPIVSYNISAIQDLVENLQEGLIVEKFDIFKFAEAMMYISHNYEDRKYMSRNCCEVSKRFSIDSIFNEWALIIEQ